MGILKPLSRDNPITGASNKSRRWRNNGRLLDNTAIDIHRDQAANAGIVTTILFMQI
ncbi:MAG: hypothetical protein LBU39_07030 [Desulfobulbaceae bacterium]|jgi:hypothetical protein|nr:hypothetical protein [Desulfobulbaceae bacterium]